MITTKHISKFKFLQLLVGAGIILGINPAQAGQADTSKQPDLSKITKELAELKKTQKGKENCPKIINLVGMHDKLAAASGLEKEQYSNKEREFWLKDCVGGANPPPRPSKAPHADPLPSQAQDTSAPRRPRADAMVKRGLPTRPSSPPPVPHVANDGPPTHLPPVFPETGEHHASGDPHQHPPIDVPVLPIPPKAPTLPQTSGSGKALLPTPPKAPTLPPTSGASSASGTGAPKNLLADIHKGKELKHVDTNPPKASDKAAATKDENPLAAALKGALDKRRGPIAGHQDTHDSSSSDTDWD